MTTGHSGKGAAANAAAFVIGPAAVAAGVAWLVAANPPDFAHPSQAEALKLQAMAPFLALGALGVYLSVSSRMAPSALSAQRFGAMLAASLLSGAIFGILTLAADYFSGFSRLVAASLGVESIHIAFPASLYVYTAGAVVVESLYRLIPIPILYALIARVLLKGRGEAVVFWMLAALTSLIEPLSQAPLAGKEPSLVWLVFGLAFVFNMLEAGLLRRYGWLAPLLARLMFYGVWHVALGPLLAGTL